MKKSYGLRGRNIWSIQKKAVGMKDASSWLPLALLTMTIYIITGPLTTPPEAGLLL